MTLKLKILLISLLGLTLLGLFLINTQPKIITTPEPASNLTLTFLDIGQGDATLIQTPNKLKILIDGGPDNKILERLGQALPFYERNLDILILTHPHADHLTGMLEVIKRYNIGQIYYTGALTTTPDYLEWLQLIKDKKNPLKIVSHPFDLPLEENLTLKFLYPNKDFTNKKLANLNNTSIVTKLVYGSTSCLFMGDAEVPVEEELLATGADLQADILKVGHHASVSASSEKFLNAVKPKFAIVSVGVGNSFGHPHLLILRRLERLGINILRTDEIGNIVFKSNGKNFIEQSRNR